MKGTQPKPTTHQALSKRNFNNLWGSANTSNDYGKLLIQPINILQWSGCHTRDKEVNKTHMETAYWSLQ